MRGAAPLLVLGALLAPLLIGSQAQSSSAPPALTTSSTAMMAVDGTSANAKWPERPLAKFTDPFERPRTPTAQPRGVGVPAISAHEALASQAPVSVANADPVTLTPPGSGLPDAQVQEGVPDTTRQAPRVTQTPPGSGLPDADSQQSVTDAALQAIQGAQTEYTWADGDRTLTVTLQTDLVIVPADRAVTDALGTTPDGVVTRFASSSGRSTGQPVFRSSSGALMTLPGGVVLLLDQDWSRKRVDQFLEDNGISRSRVSELGWIDNGYFIETAPGFPSLTLANTLAGQDGVEISSPNWWQEFELK